VAPFDEKGVEEFMFRPVSPREFVAIAGSLGAIVAVTMGLRALPDVSPTTAALGFLLVVLVSATLASLRTAIAVSVAAMLTLNFFFSAAGRRVHHLRPAELDRALRLPRGRGHRQQAVDRGS
jgi:K+-sensing histidine kinase KdpD